MRKLIMSRLRGLGIVLWLLFVIVLLAMTNIQAGAQDIRVLCVNDSALSEFDKDSNKAITVAELYDAVAANPNNEYLKDLLAEVDQGGFTEVQYTGRCHAESGSGETVVVSRSESESVVVVESQTSVQTSGESAHGQDGESVSVTSQQESRAEVRIGSEGIVVCAPSPQLALIDTDDDGIVSIEEIDRLIDLVGGNEDLQVLRDQAVEEGIIGIQYRDCVPGTPAATPISATPMATPDGEATPAASAIERIASGRSSALQIGSVKTLLNAGIGGTAFVVVILLARGIRTK